MSGGIAGAGIAGGGIAGAGIAGVVLDLDGTLHDHDSAAAAGLAEWLAGLGTAVDAPLEAEWLRIEREWFARLERGELDFPGMRRGRIRAFLPRIGRPAPSSDAEAEARFADYLAAYRRHWRPYPEAPEFVERLLALGLPTAVLSNGTTATQRGKLEALGIGARLGPLITAEDAGAPKPDHRMYAAACDALGLPPGAVLHVGDRYDLDVVAPRAFGMRAVHVDRAGAGREPGAVADLLGVLAQLEG